MSDRVFSEPSALLRLVEKNPASGRPAWSRQWSLAVRALVTRRELSGLDERQLHDIGVDRASAEREANRTPWDLGPAPHRKQPSPSHAEGTSLQKAWWRFRSRQRIAQLDASALKDIGVSYAEAEAEANKPFWRA